MENHSVQRLALLNSKLPEIKKSISVLENILKLKENKSLSQLSIDFELDETIYSEGKVNLDTCEVAHIWLGANVMVEYPLAEGLALLREKEEIVKSRLEKCSEENLYIREQITTLEVNMARLYNWSILNKQKN